VLLGGFCRSYTVIFLILSNIIDKKFNLKSSYMVDTVW
jgi:hypothetical protein